MRRRSRRSPPPRSAACAIVSSRAARADTRPSTLRNAQEVQCRSASQAWMEEPCTQEESGAMEEASADFRSTLAWLPHSGNFPSMTRWHERMRTCAVRCSNALLHGDLSSAARSTAGDCCSSSGLVRATYTHFSNAVRYFGSRLLPCSVVHAGRRVSSVRAYILKWEVK